MVAQADIVARLLKRDLLLTPEHVQRADRCIEIFVAEKEGLYCPICTVKIERLVKFPAAPDERKQRVESAPDDYDIERIALSVAALVASAAWQLCQLFTQR